MKARSQFSSIPTKHSRESGQEKLPRWTKAAVLRQLKEVADPRVRAKMAYFGVHVPKAHGISAPVLHQFAKHIGKDHALAQELWATGIHEARILATLIGESERVTTAEMDRWVRDFDSWDVVDAACCYLYEQARPAWKKKTEVKWGLGNIGKRNMRLNREAIRAAEGIREQGSRSARWIAADALRELKSDGVQKRLQRKTS